MPDLNTRLLVKKLWDTFHIPIFTLVDADPHGDLLFIFETELNHICSFVLFCS